MKQRSTVCALCLTAAVALVPSGCGLFGNKDASFRKQVAADQFPSAEKAGLATKSDTSPSKDNDCPPNTQ